MLGLYEIIKNHQLEGLRALRRRPVLRPAAGAGGEVSFNRYAWAKAPRFDREALLLAG